MATLQKIRSKGPLLVGVIALALFAFVAGDALKVFQPQQPHDVGEVDGFPLSIADYSKMVDEFSEIQKSMYGLTSLSEEQLNAVKDNVWNTYVDNQLIETQAELVGLTVTQQEVESELDKGTNPILRMFPMFFNQETNHFDKDLLFQFLAEYAQVTKTPGVDPNYVASLQRVHSFWAFAEKSIIQNVLATKYLTLISPAIITNKVEAEKYYQGRVNQADLALAVFPFSAINEDIQVTEADLKKEYDANKARFVQKDESRIVKYIDVKVTPSAADVDNLEKEVAEYTEMLKADNADLNSIINNTSNSLVPFNDAYLSLNAYPQDIVAYVKDSQVAVGEVFGPVTSHQDGTINTFKVVEKKTLPDAIQFRMVMIGNLAPEALVKRTDSIVNVLNKGGDFVAIAESEGQPSEAQWISENNINNIQLLELYNNLSQMKKNEVKTIANPNGNLIIQVVDNKDMVDKYKLAIVKRAMEISDDTANSAYNKFSQFVSENPTLEKMEANAEEAGYQILSTEMTTSMHGVANIPSTKDALRWVFSAKDGQLSNIYECGENNDHLLVVGLSEIVKPGYRPLHLVEAGLKIKVLNDKKAELIQNEIAQAKPTTMDAYGQLKYAQLASVKYVTFDQNAYINEVNGNEGVVSGYASVGKEGAISNAVQGNFGVYVMDVEGRSTLQDTTFDLAKETETIEKSYSYYTNYNTILSDLVDKATIVDNRYKFF